MEKEVDSHFLETPVGFETTSDEQNIFKITLVFIPHTKSYTKLAPTIFLEIIIVRAFYFFLFCFL